MSFFGGNPLATQVGQLIEQATDPNQPEDNWALYIEICDLINSLDEGPKDAIKAIKKKLTSNVGKNYSVIMTTLVILETCVKNCGKRFHIQVANKDFLQEMVKIIGPKNEPPLVIQEKILCLIQTWADAFTGTPELKEVCKTYMELKNKGITFPMTDLDSMAPIHTPARTSTLPSPPASPQQQAMPPSHAPAFASYPPAHTPAQVPYSGSQAPYPPAQNAYPPAQNAYPPAQMPAQPASGPVTLNPEQMAKLRSELDTVQQNIKVFSEMLADPNTGQPDDLDLLRDLDRTCKQMQHRVVDLIERVQNEEVTGELLRINDELNNVFLRYERVQRLRGSVGQTQAAPVAQPPLAGLVGPAPPYSQATTMPEPSPAYPGPPEQSAGPVVGNLIDLDTGPSQTPHPASTNDINLQLAGMNVGSNNVSTTLGQTGTTTTNTQEADEFDMFAQSRQSFEQNKQSMNTGPPTYSMASGDQYQGGLGAAVNAKNTGAPAFQQPAKDSASEIEEMEKWLLENPGPQESATSSEFDRFLAERAKAADDLPDANPPPGGARANARGGRQMQKDDPENALFAL